MGTALSTTATVIRQLCCDDPATRCTVAAIRAHKNTNQLECEPMSNVMAAVPNIGGALCSMPQSLADARYYSAVQ